MTKRKIDHSDSPFGIAPTLAFHPDVDMDCQFGSNSTEINTGMQIDIDPSRLTPVPASPSWSAMQIDGTPGSGRTRKRHRDNRPSQAEIHENTISKLFSAQRRLSPFPDLPPSISEDMPLSRHDSAMSSMEPTPIYGGDNHEVIPSQSSTTPPQRTNLHSFWNIDRKSNEVNTSTTTSTASPSSAGALASTPPISSSALVATTQTRARSNTHPTQFLHGNRTTQYLSQPQSQHPLISPSSQGSSQGHFGCELCDRIIRPNVTNTNTSTWFAPEVGIDQLREEYLCRRCCRIACHLCAVVMAERRCLDCLRP